MPSTVRHAIATALLLLCHAIGAAAATQMYRSLGGYSSRQLMQMGVESMGRSMRSDTAMVCFTIVSNRYYDDMAQDEKYRCAAAMNNLACIYTYGRINYPQAYRYLTRGLSIARENGFGQLLATFHNNLGNIYSIYGKQLELESMLRKARQMYRESYRQATRTGDHYLRVSAFINIMDAGKADSLQFFRGIFDRRIPAATNSLAHARLLFRAAEAEQAGRYAEARAFYRRMLRAINQRWMREEYVAGAHMRMGDTYVAEQRYDSARQAYAEALRIAGESGNMEQTASATRKLERLARLTGDAAAASRLHQELLARRDSLMTAFGLSSIGDLSSRDELRQAEEKTQQLAAAQRVRQTVTHMLCLLLAIVVGFLLIVARKNRKLRQSNRLLYDKNRALLSAENGQAARTGGRKYESSSLADEEKTRLLERVQDILRQSEWICRSDFSLPQLAKLVGSNKTYVSQVINEHYGQTFNTILGDCRVKEACRRIDDHEHYGQYTLESISESVGFKSRTTFTTSFKRLVGLTPSEYLRLSRERNAS